MKKKHSPRVLKRAPKKNSRLLLYVFILLLVILGSLALIQTPQDVRNFAEEGDITPTPITEEITPTEHSTPTLTPSPTEPPIPTATETPIPTPTHTPIPMPTQTPEPQPTNTPSISPTPIYRCNTDCNSNAQCPTGLVCAIGKCRQAACSNETDCSCLIVPTAKPAVPTATRAVSATIASIPSPTRAIAAVQEPTIYPTLMPTSASPNNQFAFPTVQPYVPATKNSSLLDMIVNFFSDTICRVFGCTNE